MKRSSAGPPRRGARGAPPLEPTVSRLRALAHPLRLQLLEVFAEGPRTVREVAERLGMPRTRLYHHVNALAGAGILRVRERRPKRGTVEQQYEIVPSDARPSPRLPAHRHIPPDLASAVMERARNDLVAALSGPAGSSVVLIHLLAGDRQFVAAVRRHVRAIVREAKRAEGRAVSMARAERRPARRAAERWTLTVALVPKAPPSARGE